MGLALSLFPIEHLHYGGGPSSCWGYSHTVLNLGGLTWDLGQLIEAAAKFLPDHHNINTLTAGRIKDGTSKGERYYGVLDKDCYGSPYKWITAVVLLPFLVEHWPKHPVTAYVRTMPDDGMIVLDWT
jgi:hypothetical protein